MGLHQRRKGQSGERELAEMLTSITGHVVTRRVRQHDGDDDLTGLPGWSAECKRHKAAKPGTVDQWWLQAREQAARTGAKPVLFWRADRMPWRARWLLQGCAVEAAIADWWRLQQQPHRDHAEPAIVDPGPI